MIDNPDTPSSRDAVAERLRTLELTIALLTASPEYSIADIGETLELVDTWLKTGAIPARAKQPSLTAHRGGRSDPTSAA